MMPTSHKRLLSLSQVYREISFLLFVLVLISFPKDFYASAIEGKKEGHKTISGANEQVSPSRLYEAVLGYRGGFETKDQIEKSRKEKPRIPKYRYSSPAQAGETEAKAALEKDEVLIERRMQRNEWDLAMMSLDRAILSTQKIASAEDTQKLSEMLNTARQKASEKPQAAGQPGEVVNSIGMRLVFIPPGTFEMGSSQAEIRRLQAEWNVEESMIQPETPNHQVKITKPFLMGKYPVTVGEFKKFINETGYRTTAEKQGWAWVYSNTKKHWVRKNGASWKNPGTKLWDDHPVTLVSYQDAEAFCEWLSRRENRKYFLPTEAQWEYAARGGKQGERFPWGNEYPDGKKANLADRQSDLPWADRTLDDGFAATSPVGNYEPNEYWLYDMVGNVWQYCSDFYDPKAYESMASGVTDPTGPRTGKQKVVRGGNWAFGAGIARNAFRFGVDPELCTDISGFRVAAVPWPGEEAVQESSVPLATDQINRLLERVKKLVASGHRIEARKIVDNINQRSLPSQIDAQLFTMAILNSLIDITKDKSLPTFTNSLNMTMVRIPPGSFVMGSSEADIAWVLTTLAPGQPVNLENEYPYHKVRISRPFYISATEVTVAQFKAFVDETGYVTDAEEDNGGQIYNTQNRRFEQKEGTSWKNPGWTVTPDQPVTMISYNDAQAFVEWLSAKEKLPYKLPTEAQWEYAARGGIPMAQFPWGDTLPDGRKANYADKNKDFEWSDRNADCGYKYVAPVGSYEPNGYGLYDMAGNVLEWVRDYYGEDYYKFTPEIDPEGPGHGEYRVMKGGEWTFGAVNLRCAFRGWSRPEMAFYNSGFRVAIELGSDRHLFYFSNDFLTKQWVPDPDQRTVALAISKEKERRAMYEPTPTTTESKGQQKLIDDQSIKGLLVVDLTPKSDARKAGIQKGDIIIEYNGIRDLTAEKFLALTAVTKRDKTRPLIVFARDGYEYSVRLSPGLLGISVMDVTIRGPLKKVQPQIPEEQHDKKAKPMDWT